MHRYDRRTFLGHAAAGLGTAAMAARFAPAAEGASPRLPMKFAICNETFQDWPHDRAFAFAAECGYTGVEIAPFTINEYVMAIPAQKRVEIRRLAEKEKLQVVGLHWLLAKTKGFHLTSPDASVRRKTADYLGELARFCADLGGKILVVGSPKQRDLLPGVTRSEAMKYAAEVVRAALPVLEKTGTLLAIEPLDPGTTTFITTADDGMELVRLVDSPLCRLHLDCRAMTSERVPIPELIHKHRAALAHFHANDGNSQGPGFGKLDFVPIFRALREIDYGGWVSVEVFDYSPGVERLARESVAYMKKCLAEADRPLGVR